MPRGLGTSAVSRSQSQRSLRQRLQEVQVEWPEEGNRYFIPINELHKLVRRNYVEAELRSMYRLNEEEVSAYSEYICDKAKNLFTVLLCGSSAIIRESILDFVEDKISDDDLPFGRGYSPTTEPFNTYRRPFGLCRRNHLRCHLSDHRACGIEALSTWPQPEISHLCRDQWLVLAPVFRRIPGDIPYLELDDNTVLPFIEDQEGSPNLIRGGGYSEVWGVRIHSAHQDLLQKLRSQRQEPLMAVKRLFSREQKDFQKEFHMLSRLTLLNHPHLVKLLASYKLKDKYHFLFPYANANLRSHWDSIGMPYWNPETCLWTLSQMSGLTSGLEAIHNFRTPPTLTLGSETGNNALTRFRPVRGRLTVLQDEEMFGRHGDLKPENILWSNELEEAGIAGILQIADLGLGRFHRLESRSQVDPKTVNGSPTYTPPEISLEIPVSRAYDIWSLGCVFLEFITWLLEGSAGIYKFSEARSAVAFDGFNDDLFFTLVSPELGRQYAVVRDGVTSWIRYLHQSRRCSPAINDLLKLIQDHMIVVDSRSRIPAKKLDQEIKQIFETAKANPEYLLGKNPSTLDTGLGIKMPKVAAVQSTDDSDIPSIQIQGP